MTGRQDIEAGKAGAVAGAGATVVMSAVMLAGRRAGLMPALPPHDIADDLVERSPADDAVPHGGRVALGWALHLGFGAAAGAAYAVARRRLRPSMPAPLSGTLFALGVWAVSYLGWVPALGSLPSAIDDRPGRPATMIAAHVIFGLLLGASVQRLRPRDQP